MWKPYLCQDAQLWDGYVLSRPGLSPFLLYHWSSIIEKSYGHQPYFLALAAGGGAATRFSAVLPLIHFNSPAGPSRLISLPYLDYAGLAADDCQSGAELLDAALALAGELGADHVELRQDAHYALTAQMPADQGWNRHSFAFKIGLSRSLPGDAGILWQDLGAKVRNQIRKARKYGCRPTVGGEELLDPFYTIFATNMRDLGSPVHSYDFFTEIFKTFETAARIVLIEKEGVPLASSIVIRKGNTLYNPWASSLRAYRPLCPNMMLYWTMLSWACDLGLSCFDFGRSSPASSTYRFKKQWGAESRPLSWEIFSLPGYDWHPEKESLNLKGWKTLSLAESYRTGPGVRRGISL